MSSIRALRNLCLLAAIMTVQTAPAIAVDSYKKVTASVSRFPAWRDAIAIDSYKNIIASTIQEARRLDRKGDLAGARNSVSRAWFLYASTHYTPVPVTGELPDGYWYLFPQGQAMRLFNWCLGTQLIYAKVQGDTFAVTWQAQLEQANARISGRNTGKKVEELPFVSAAGYTIVREWGDRPPADTPLVFFTWQPVTGVIMYGRINSSGDELPAYGWNHSYPAAQFQTVRVPDRLLTRREYRKEILTRREYWKKHPWMYGMVPMSSFTDVGGSFIPNRPGSRSGHYIWKIPKLPKIPGEAASPGEVPPLKSGGNSKPENEMSGSIGWTWTSHPVTVGDIMRRTDAKHPATIGFIHVKDGSVDENWWVQVFKSDSAGGVKCVVLDEKRRLVAVTLVMIGQLTRGNYGHHVGIRLFRTDIDRWPKEYVWGGGGAKRDSVVEGQTKNVVVLSRVLQFPGHLNLGVAEWP